MREVDVEVEVILRTAPPQSESLTSERRHVTAQFEGARVAGARERNLSIQVSQFQIGDNRLARDADIDVVSNDRIGPRADEAVTGRYEVGAVRCARFKFPSPIPYVPRERQLFPPETQVAKDLLEIILVMTADGKPFGTFVYYLAPPDRIGKQRVQFAPKAVRHVHGHPSRVIGANLASRDVARE